MKTQKRTLLAMLICALLGTAAVPSTASATRTWFNYNRNSSTVHGSITFNCDVSTCVSRSYRAGAGNGGRNACQKNNWIPIGTYKNNFHRDDFAGSKIRGRVWKISDYQCKSGVIRNDLFVHSEETSSRRQACSTSGDDPFCWEGPNDYYSNGCIKVARRRPNDLRKLDGWAHGFNRGKLNWVSVSR